MDSSTPATKPRRRRKRICYQEGPDPIDVHVGARLRLRRIMMGLTQHVLGQNLGITFQQVQKYEKGTNRISASTLHRIAETLDVPVSFFFDDFQSEPLPHAPEDSLARRESLELLRSYYRINQQTRKQLYQLIRAMGQDGANEDEPPDA